MVTRIRYDDAELDVVGHIQVHRYLRRDGPDGIGVGTARYGPLPEGLDPRSIWESHDVPEIHYILAGKGVLLEEDDLIDLEAGDIVITAPGRRHVLWGAEDDPLVAVYAAVSRSAT